MEPFSKLDTAKSWDQFLGNDKTRPWSLFCQDLHAAKTATTYLCKTKEEPDAARYFQRLIDVVLHGIPAAVTLAIIYPIIQRCPVSSRADAGVTHAADSVTIYTARQLQKR